MPVIIYNFINSVGLLSDAMNSFTDRALSGLEVNKKKMRSNLENSLMLVTALNQVIGYEKSAEIAKKAYAEGTSLKEAALSLQYLDEESFDRAVDPEKML